MSDLVKKNERKFNLGDFVLDNIVTIIFWVFIILGLALAKSVTFTGSSRSSATASTATPSWCCPYNPGNRRLGA